MFTLFQTAGIFNSFKIKYYGHLLPYIFTVYTHKLNTLYYSTKIYINKLSHTNFKLKCWLT